MLKSQFEKTNKKLDQIITDSSKSNDQKKIQMNSAYINYLEYQHAHKNKGSSLTDQQQSYKNKLNEKIAVINDFNPEQLQAYIALQKNINILEKNPDISGVNLAKSDNLFKDLLNDNKNHFRKPALEEKWKEWEIAHERNNRTQQQKQKQKLNQQRKKRAQKILRTSLLLLGIVLCLIAIYFLYIQLRKRLQGNRVVEEEPVVVVEEEPVVVVEEEPVVVEDVIEDVVEDVVEENNSFFFFLVFLSLVTIYYFKFKKKTKTKTKTKSRK